MSAAHAQPYRGGRHRKEDRMPEYRTPRPYDQTGFSRWMQDRGVDIAVAEQVAPYAEVLYRHPDLHAVVRAGIVAPGADGDADTLDELMGAHAALDDRLRTVAKDRRFRPLYRTQAWEQTRRFAGTAFGVMILLAALAATAHLLAGVGGLDSAIAEVLTVGAAAAGGILIALLVFIFTRPWTDDQAHEILVAASVVVSSSATQPDQ